MSYIGRLPIKIPSGVSIKLLNKNSIILIDHTKSIILRKLMEDNIDKLGLKPIKTSGTLKALRK